MPVTPQTSPGRFTKEEAALFNAGKCSCQTAYGTPYTEHCGEPSQPGADFGDCPEHAEAHQ
jgi:hypothetical protein